jgi:hypothetical protein
MYNNNLARTSSKAPAPMLQPHRMCQLKEAVMMELASSVVQLVILQGNARPERQFLEK